MKVKIYIDGASRGNPGPASCACIIKDAKGITVYERGIFLGKATNNFAEFSALKLALKSILKLNGSIAEVYSDSELLVNQYNGIYKIKNPDLFTLMVEIRTLAEKLKGVKLIHIRRDLNSDADKLANITLNREVCKLAKDGKTDLLKK